ncbi:MAG TPA: MaoC family dehydratase [Albitalea sp.]|uniref:MaoC family dehydratase n=1 Tax=Piscinibacter sp. TaxID=1903157 RepID=UPI002ED4367E
MTSTTTLNLSTIDLHVGRELGVSGWMLVDQQRIDGFAQCTGDDQWIHVDAERARRESPFGSTIAHGYLTLATLATSAFEVYIKAAGIAQAVNYGLDKVRFIAPVKAGARIRTRIRLIEAQRKADNRVLITTENTVEIEGHAKPALVAHALLLLAA